MIDYIVIGSGFAGAVLAERMASQLNKKVLVIERRNHIAGNCYDYRDANNILVHKYGPHLFHTNHKDVVEYLSGFTSWEIYSHEVLACIDGKKVPIPFNFNTLHELFPRQMAVQLEDRLLKNYSYNSKVPILELKKSTDKELQFLADFIYEKVFLNYTAKHWGMRPEEMDGSVTARVPIFIGRDNRYFNDSYQMIPKDGYTHLIENILSHKNIKLMLNTDFREICELRDGDFYLFGTRFEGKVIYTGQIDELFELRFGALSYKSVKMEFESVEKEFYQEKATVNYPNDYSFTRITEFKHIHPSVSQKTTILKEYPQEYEMGRNIPYYPVFTDQEREKYDRYLDYAKKVKNLVLVGRLAEYKYYDMDDIVKRALDTFESGLKNKF